MTRIPAVSPEEAGPLILVSVLVAAQELFVCSVKMVT